MRLSFPHQLCIGMKKVGMWKAPTIIGVKSSGHGESTGVICAIPPTMAITLVLEKIRQTPQKEGG